MYEHNANQMILPHEFFLPFEGHLNPDNRWVRMASVIPWTDLEEAYLESLSDPNQGSKAYTVQFALGALIIKERLRLSNEETVEAITENPYMQYFIGLPDFQETSPFQNSKGIEQGKQIGKEEALAEVAAKQLTERFGKLLLDIKEAIMEADLIELGLLLSTIFRYESVEDVWKYMR